MIRIHAIRVATVSAAFALTCCLPALADDMVSFATAGYASGLRTPEVMHKIDTDGDGMVSHDEYIAYQSKVFDMMDTCTSHKGMLGKEEMLATGGANTH